MADNYYNPNFSGTGGHIDPNETDREKQERANMEVMGASSALMHANYENSFHTTGEEVTEQQYNMIIGVMLLYGFVVNAILCFALTKQVMRINPVALVVIYFAGMIIGMIVCRKTQNPVVSFIGYNLIVVPLGLFITPILAMYQISTIRYAFCVMAVCTLLMIGLANMYPVFFRSIGRMLFGCFLVAMLGEVIMWCVGLSSGIFDFVFVGLLMGYVGFDWAVAQNKRKTKANAIISAGLIFADMIYMLIRLLRILSKRNN